MEISTFGRITDKKKLEIIARDQFIEQLKRAFGSGEKVVVIVRSFDNSKSTKMYSYLFSHLAPICLDYIRHTCGYDEVRTKEQAVDFMKYALGFTKKVYTPEGEMEQAKSFKDKSISQKEVSQFVEDLARHLIVNGMEVMMPGQYEKSQGDFLG